MFRSPYVNPPNPDEDGVDFKGTKSYAKQEFKDECDINRIMARYTRSGVFPPAVSVGRYGDFSDVDDFHSAQNLLIKAREQFAGLPAKVRDRFKNNPAEFLEFVHNKDNYKEALELGLLSDEARLKADEAAKKAAVDTGVKSN